MSSTTISTFDSSLMTDFTNNIIFDTVDWGVQISQLSYTVIASCTSGDGAEVVLNSSNLQDS